VPFALGARGATRRWGEGVVQRYEDRRGSRSSSTTSAYKTLALDLVVERSLLHPA
jgi:hypothetical protein